MSPMPEWLEHQLNLKRGAPTGFRYARRERCAKCLAVVLVGANQNWCAWSVAVDPSPLDDDGEAMAFAEGKTTYALRRVGRGLQLDRRDQWQREGTKPESVPRTGPFGFVVVADHRCRKDLPWYQE